MLNQRQQVSAIKRLIKACGGLEEAARALQGTERPYSVAQLSRCQTVSSGCTIPLSVIALLEEYCGESIIGQALLDARPTEAEIGNLMNEAAETTEAAAGFQAKVRRAIADGTVSAAEQADLEREAEELFEQARQSREAVARLRVAA